MRSYISRFSYALKWNFVESAYYQMLVFAHYAFMHQLVISELFAQIGSLFSLIYLLRTIIEGGLEAMISSNIRDIRSKKAFVIILFFHIMIPSFILYPLAIAACYYIFNILLGPLPWLLLGISGLQIIVELIKKVSKIFLGLTFQNKAVAIIESLSVSSYIFLFWALYLIKGASLYITFGLYLCTTSLTTLLLCYFVYQWYETLPDQQDILPSISYTHRLYTYGTQLMMMLFSGNFLVPLLATRCKVVDSGLFYLAHTITYGINKVLRHTFGYSIQTLFAWIKHQLEETDAFISTMSYRIYLTLTALVILATSAYAIQLISGPSHTLHAVSIFLLFFLLQLSENLFLIFEQLCITHDAGFYLFIVSLGTILSTGTILWYASAHSTFTLFIALLLLRAIKFGITQWLMYNKERRLLHMG